MREKNQFSFAKRLLTIAALQFNAILSMTIFFIPNLVHAQFFAERMLGTTNDNDNGYDINRAVSGNIYTTGCFRTTVDFDPGPGIKNLSTGGTSGSSPDIYIAKYTNSGGLLWAFNLGTAGGTDEGHGIVSDASDNLYVTGFYSGTVDFDPSAGISNMTATGTQDIFIAQYTSSGTLGWAKHFGSSGTLNQGLSIYIDPSNNVYITGQFKGTINFGGGAISSNAGSTDIFVASFTSTGAYRWAFSIGSTTNNDYGTKITGDGTNIYVTGSFGGSSKTADFNPSAGVANLTSCSSGFGGDMFLAAYTCAGGSWVWSFNLGGSNTNEGDGLFTDGTYVYCSGIFYSTDADFNPGAGVVNLSTTSAYFAKYSCATGAYQWAQSIGATQAYTILMENGILYLSGYFSGTKDFDPGPSVFPLTSPGITDLFLGAYDPSDGSLYCVMNVGLAPNSICYGRALCGDAGSGYVYLTGWFSLTSVNFNPNSTATYLSAAGSSSDVYIAKYSYSTNIISASCQRTVLPVELSFFKSECTPRHSYLLSWQTLSEKNNHSFTIQHSTDGLNWIDLSRVKGSAHSLTPKNYQFETYPHADSTLYFRLIQTDLNGQRKYYSIIRQKTCNLNNVNQSSLYPNPSSGLIEFCFSGEMPDIKSTEVYDLSGKIIYKGTGFQNKIDLGFLSNGCYFLYFRQEIYTKPYKFFIQK